MKSKLKNNWHLKLISLLFAIGLWYYVVMDKNPTTTANYKNIEVTIRNEDYLTKRNLAIVEPTEPVVNVELRGNIKKLNDIKRSDIIVTADMYGVTGDSAEIDLKYTVPDGVTIVNKSQDKMTFKFDEEVTDKFPVKVETIGELPSNSMQLIEAEAVPKEVKISGFRKEIAKIDKDKVKVTLDLSVITESGKITKDIEVYDKNGDLMKDLIMDKTKATINIYIANSKQVSIKPVIKNEPENFSMSDLKLSKDKVTILGEEKIIKDITEISTEPIDLEGVTGNATLKVKLDLPEGVTLLTGENGEDTIDVQIFTNTEETGISSKRLVKKLSDLQIVNNENNSGILFTNSETDINIDIYGLEDSIKNIKVDDIILSIDVKNLEKGKHEVPIKVESIEGVSNITINPSKVNIEIE
ncbi:YbbR-like domain-containing protein [Miniphocaeibacter halophilus]|uniref:Uncharacterized protein n=1 Tax=Miniphocaeibacter halophilus TaxID=2931922 RepID=A0AC61MUF5_9FIRM|nr:CdaR family protein [Miniphocaeibacter halophilus]QQK07879.1 hypothetical protein JFY71_11495 [Miniphocaeibacter halophilus]